ncbi:nSTAND1 domain-containing NTPase, partial [Haemophilus parainfluenzae]|uniref:nSTAND1 domain-containing NTPase n=1 Tax=Haemophilus parainfluenzae TaxID=729 RepID=UPI001788D50C
TASLTRQVQTSPFCAVLGPAGIGKTSLLRAGLIPALQRLNQVSSDHDFEIRYLTPGQTPLKRLAEVFIDVGVQGLERSEQLRRAESFL